jgi:hypothetical protein
MEHVKGMGPGGFARTGVAEVEVGGRAKAFPIQVTADLNGVAKFLLGNEVMEEFGMIMDWGTHSLKSKEGEEVKFEMKPVSEGAYAAFITQKVELGPGEGRWMEAKVATGILDGPIHVCQTPTSGNICAIDSICLIKDGKAYIPIQNYGDKQEGIERGREMAAFTIVCEEKTKSGEKILRYKGKSWVSEDRKGKGGRDKKAKGERGKENKSRTRSSTNSCWRRATSCRRAKKSMLRRRC